MRKSGFCRPERARPDSEGTEAEAPIGKSEDRHTALRGPLVPLQKQNGPRQQTWKRPSRSSTRTRSLAQGPPAHPQLPRGDADLPPPQEKSGGARPAGACRPRKRSAGTNDVNGHSAKKKKNKTIVKKKKKTTIKKAGSTSVSRRLLFIFGQSTNRQSWSEAAENKTVPLCREAMNKPSF